MRIAYIGINLNYKNLTSGVGKKLRQQVQIWREYGHDARLFVISSQPLEWFDTSAYLYKVGKESLTLRILKSLPGYLRTVAKLIVGVADFKPDIIYMRNVQWLPPLSRLYKIAPVIIESNTDDVSETRAYGLVYHLYTRLTRRLILKPASGFVWVSHEIAQRPYNAVFSQPGIVIANGIDLVNYKTIPPPSNNHPRLVMAVSPGAPWHGVDKAISLAWRYPDLYLDLVGYNPDDLDNAPQNIQAHGLLPHDQLLSVLKNADVSLGTLALHRINMHEASPLKVREAIAYGIPLVIAFKDTDLDDLNLDTILKIPNSEDNVATNAESIRSFAYRMRGQRIPRQQIADRIDWRRKELDRLEFFQQFVRNE